MDIFSFCLLTPFEAAMSWHLRQHGSVYFEQSNPGEEDQAFLRKFFDALLESVFFDVQSAENNELFMRDPSIASITRGFVLAQRVMLRFNLHPVTVPQLEPMSDHYLWEVWDVVLDFCVGLSKSGAFDMIYELFITSFSKFPRAGYFPLLSFLLKVPEYHDRTAATLLDFLDRNDNVIEVASRSTIPKAILELTKPTATVLIVLAKVLSVQKALAFDQHTPINFAASSTSDVLSAGMLSIACALANQNVPMLAKLTRLCIDHAADCAPYSSVLLVLSIARAGKLLTVPHFAPEFLPLLDSPRDDIRAATALLLGTSKDHAVLPPIAALMRDHSPIVREFALFGTVQLLRTQPNPEITTMLEAVGEDDNEKVKRAWTSLKTVIAAITAKAADPLPPDQICGHDEMLKALVKSVKATHFLERMSVNIFL
jgi:hypothetical protein